MKTTLKNTNNYLSADIQGIVTFESKNFKIDYNIACWRISSESHGYLSADDGEEYVEKFWFRGDLAKMNVINARLKEASMSELIKELDDLLGYAKDNAERILVKNNKDYLSQSFKADESVKHYSLFEHLPLEKQDSLKIKYYIDNTNKIPSTYTRLNIVNWLRSDKIKDTRDKIRSDEEIYNKPLTVKWLKKMLKKLNK